MMRRFSTPRRQRPQPVEPPARTHHGPPIDGKTFADIMLRCACWRLQRFLLNKQSDVGQQQQHVVLPDDALDTAHVAPVPAAKKGFATHAYIFGLELGLHVRGRRNSVQRSCWCSALPHIHSARQAAILKYRLRLQYMSSSR